MTPQLKDRWLQIFLTQARGKTRNGDLLRQAVDRSLRIVRARTQVSEAPYMDDALIQTLLEVTSVLERLRIPHAVTGSVASSIHGEVFQSMDADVILLASPRDATQVAQSLGSRFYAPVDMLSEAATTRSFANVIDNRTGLKVDLSFIGEDPYLHRVLERRIRSTIGSHPAEFWFVTPEDIILMKLVWRKDTQSAKQWENALGVVRVRGTRMDWAYLRREAEALCLLNDLDRLRDEAGV